MLLRDVERKLQILLDDYFEADLSFGDLPFFSCGDSDGLHDELAYLIYCVGYAAALEEEGINA